MSSVLNATIRTEKGKGAVHRLRQAGRIPAVLYGETQANISLNAGEVRKYYSAKGFSRLITLRLDNAGKTEDLPILVKEVQFHPVKGNPLHMDLLQVSMKEKVVVKVPVVLVGEDQRTNDGSIIDLALYEVEVSCLPGDIPAKIEVDISELTMNNNITVSELQAPAGVEFVTVATEPVVVAHVPRIEEEEPEEKEEQEEGVAAESQQEEE
ncbi:MAG TPA: 50S ribosomal protein L25 [Firmicutes bacterium]|nr:50S ribosomal protein L25 [Bacillota bacterium]